MVWSQEAMIRWYDRAVTPERFQVLLGDPPPPTLKVRQPTTTR